MFAWMVQSVNSSKFESSMQNEVTTQWESLSGKFLCTGRENFYFSKKENRFLHEYADTAIDALRLPPRQHKNLRADLSKSKFGPSSFFISFWSWWYLSIFCKTLFLWKTSSSCFAFFCHYVTRVTRPLSLISS